MRVAEYIPDDDLGKVAWLNNFANKLPGYTAKYKLDPGQVARVQQLASAFNFWIDANYQLQQFMRSVTKYKNGLITGNKNANAVNSTPSLPSCLSVLLPAGTDDNFGLAVSVSQIIKKHESFTKSDGTDLGLIGIKQKTDPETLQPELKIRLINAATPVLSWRKNGMDRVEIQVNRGDGFKPLAFSTKPSYTDISFTGKNTAVIWTYRAIYIKDDHRTGQWSGDASITVTGA